MDLSRIDHPRLRIGSAIVFAASMSLLLVAASLSPASEGLGTHQQMGIEECGWIVDGIGPCPTCGMTTAFAYAADGNLPASFLAQPAGAILALLIAMTAWVSGYTMWTGCTGVLWLRPMLRPRILLIAFALLMAGWIYKFTTYG